MTIAARQLREYIETTWPGTPISRFACRDTASGGISLERILIVVILILLIVFLASRVL